MSLPANAPVVFFDIGGTLAAPRLSAAGELAGLDVYSGVLDVLRRLQARGVRLGVVSNTPAGTSRAAMRAALDDAGLLPFLDEDLLVYSSTLPQREPPIEPKPNSSIFLYAAELTGLASSDCVFVGEDREERNGALTAGMRVAPHPRLVEDVLDGVALRYLRIGPPSSYPEGDASWAADLTDRPLVSLGVLGRAEGDVIAVAGAREARALDDAGYLVTRLGGVGAPVDTEVYLLRTDAQPDAAAGFAAGEDHSAPFFGAEVPPDPDEEPTLAAAFGEPAAGPAPSPWDYVLASTSQGLLVALPAGLSIERFHLDGARHGHTLKLVPSVNRLRAVAGPLTGLTAEAAPEPPTRDLAPHEVEALMQVDENAIRANLDRFVGLADLGDGHGPIASRHIRHADNRRAVRALATEFESLGLKTRLRPFSHEGLSLENVEAELPGARAEVVLISAHLDSTAASGGPFYRPGSDPAPGADDDGSGIAATLALARIFVELARERPLQRTLRFVLFNAEEQGLVGSQDYASRAAAEQAPIVAVFQMDMIGYFGGNQRPPRPFEVHVGHAVDGVAAASLPLAGLISRLRPTVAADLLPPQIYSNTHPEDGDPAAGRSDHASFQDHGYPACIVSEDFFVGPEADSPSPQENPNYHKPGDAAVAYGYAAQIARCIGAASLVMAAPVLTPSRDVPDAAIGEGRRPSSRASQPRGRRLMSLSIDVRKEARKSLSSQQLQAKIHSFNNRLTRGAAAARAVGESRPRSVGLNPITGTARKITLPDVVGFGVEAEAAATPADRVEQAVSLANQALGPQALAGGNTPQFVADPRVQTTSGKATVVQLSQNYLGIPIFQMSRVVNLKAKGAELVGDHTESVAPELSVQPQISAADAWLAAYRHLADNLPTEEEEDAWGGKSQPLKLKPSNEPPATLATFDQPSKPTVFSAGPLGATTPAELSIFIVSETTSRLCWKLVMTLPDAVGQYELLVSADQDEPAILYCQETSKSAVRPRPKAPTLRETPRAAASISLRRPAPKSKVVPAPVPPLTLPAGSSATTAPARGRVYEFNPTKDPALAQDERTDLDFPLPLAVYPLATTPPEGFPEPWVGPDGTAVGPYVIALKGKLDPSQPGAVLSGVASSGTVVFNPTDPYGDEQKVLNIFFFCNYMHDFFELLGFDVAAGNFEGDDGVIARAHPGQVRGTANMLTFPDHQRPLMNMGLVAGKRHTAFSADVVFHEYAHGVSNRLVGGPMNTHALNAEQSGSMGEGWSDYFALTIQNFFLAESAERFTTGDWIVGQEGVGIRNFPYDARYPFNFGDMSSNPDLQEVHNAGEIWCAALLEMNRKLTDALGSRERAYREAWQLVVDSFKLCPANPGFLDARDAILAALDARRDSGILTDEVFGRCRRAIWTAFAGFGMGAQAVNTGNEWVDAQNDFHLPADLGGTTVQRPGVRGFESKTNGYQGVATEPGFVNPDGPIPGLPEADQGDLQHLIQFWGRLSAEERSLILRLVQEYSRNAPRQLAEAPVAPAHASVNF